MRNDLDIRTFKQLKQSTYARRLLIAAPFYVLTPALFVVLANHLDLNLNARIIALGVLGWWLALLLRIPIMIAIKRLSSNDDEVRRYVVGISGPTEEVTRLAMLLTIGLNVNNAYSIGIGWAGIEVVYAILQGFVTASLQVSNTDRAKKARLLLQQQGLDETLSNNAPFYGILERLSAGAIHIGLSILLVVSPLLVLVSIPLHSLTNFTVLRLAKTSLVKAELAILAIAAVVLFTSLRLTLME